ncbi:ATP-binding protein [Nocardia vinacea]|uniref:ATP-binding protein n=1 Tax=Nocardia vinacea TaxID=96468 RepID=UPI003570D4EB
MQGEAAAREAHSGEGRIHAARFPSRKSLEEFDFNHHPSPKTRHHHPSGNPRAFVTAKVNPAFLGAPGTGETPLPITLP